MQDFSFYRIILLKIACNTSLCLNNVLIMIRLTLFIESSRVTVSKLTNQRFSPKNNWNLEVLAVLKGEQPENTEKNPRSRTRTINKLNQHGTATPRIEIRYQRCEVGANPSVLLISCMMYI